MLFVFDCIPAPSIEPQPASDCADERNVGAFENTNLQFFIFSSFDMFYRNHNFTILSGPGTITILDSFRYLQIAADSFR